MITFSSEDYVSPTISLTGGAISIEVTVVGIGPQPCEGVYTSSFGELNVYMIEDDIYFASQPISFFIDREVYTEEYTRAILKDCLMRA